MIAAFVGCAVSEFGLQRRAVNLYGLAGPGGERLERFTGFPYNRISAIKAVLHNLKDFV